MHGRLHRNRQMFPPDARVDGNHDRALWPLSRRRPCPGSPPAGPGAWSDSAWWPPSAGWPLASSVAGSGSCCAAPATSVRFGIGPLSYSAGTPGGLFAPLLAVGAVWGAQVHGIVGPLLPALGHQPSTLAIVGMATFFAAVVRAPFTGIVLIVEMTATTTLLVPMLAACFAAVLVATALGNKPIYDSLRARMPRDLA